MNVVNTDWQPRTLTVECRAKAHEETGPISICNLVSARLGDFEVWTFDNGAEHQAVPPQPISDALAQVIAAMVPSRTWRVQSVVATPV